MKFEEKLDKIVLKHKDLAVKLLEPIDTETFIKTSKEYSDLGPVVEKIESLRNAQILKQELQSLISQPVDKMNDDEKTILELYEQDLRDLEHELPRLEHAIKISLLPQDVADKKNAIIEIRAGTGGDEAGLFASNL